MARSSIESAIDAVVRCVLCGAPLGCKCWVRLRCEKCGASRLVERWPEAFDFDEILTTCPTCAKPAP